MSLRPVLDELLGHIELLRRRVATILSGAGYRLQLGRLILQWVAGSSLLELLDVSVDHLGGNSCLLDDLVRLPTDSVEPLDHQTLDGVGKILRLLDRAG